MTSELSHHVLCVVVGQVSWHFILPVRFSYLGVMRMRTLTLHPFTHAEQLYLMYLHYCKGRFRVGVGVDVNKTGSIFRCRIVLPTQVGRLLDFIFSCSWCVLWSAAVLRTKRQIDVLMHSKQNGPWVTSFTSTQPWKHILRAKFNAVCRSFHTAIWNEQVFLVRALNKMFSTFCKLYIVGYRDLFERIWHMWKMTAWRSHISPPYYILMH